jgi:hypothetical protein
MDKRQARKLYRDYCELRVALENVHSDIARSSSYGEAIQEELKEQSRKRSIQLCDKIHEIQDKLWDHLKLSDSQRKKSTMTSIARSLGFLKI